MFTLIVAALILVASSATVDGAACNWKITAQYTGSYLAEIYVVPTSTISGWTAVVTFDRAFDWFEAYTAAYSNNAGYVSTTLTPLSGSSAISSGATLTLQFLVKYSNNNSPQVAGVTLNGVNYCGTASAATATTSSPASTVATVAGVYNYTDVLAKSLMFYEAQRSGSLPSTNRISWRGNSALQDAVVGGYYDAGDNVKFGFPMAAAITQLAWGAISFKSAYDAAGQTAYIKATLKWATDYFIAAHPSANVLYVQFGDGNADHANWYRPEDNLPASRPAYQVTTSAPGSDVAAETAAALAASSIFYTMVGDTASATTCLTHAVQLFNFADQYRGKYSDSVPAAASFYTSSSYTDELGWAAAWLYNATGNATYLTKSQSFYSGNTPTQFSWDDKNAGHQILLYQFTKSATYQTAVNNFVTQILSKSTYTAKGLIYIDSWGSLRHASNLAHACLQIAKLGLNVASCKAFAKKQIGYALGDTGRSYLVGFGTNYPLQPHHRGASCPQIPAPACGWTPYNAGTANPHVITGALVGGPDSSDNYNDVRSNYQQGEVACDYNAGFTSAVAGLIYG